jgi:hypothetical protein
MDVKILNEHVFEDNKQFRMLKERVPGVVDEIKDQAYDMQPGESHSFSRSIFDAQGLVDFSYEMRLVENEDTNDDKCIELVKCEAIVKF